MISVIFRRLSSVALTVALLPFFGLCFYNQPYWDDLLFAAGARKSGIWQTQYYHYQNSGGRFASQFLSIAANPLTYGWWHGVKVTAFLFCLATAATIWFGLRSLSCKQLCKSDTTWITALLLLVYIAAIPDIHSSLYWFSGQVLHQLPMLLLVIVPVAVAKAHQHTGRQHYCWLGLAGIGTFIISGSSELVIIQLAFLLVLATALSFQRRQWASLRIWASLLSILAVTSIVHVSAPGNYVRLAISTGRVPPEPWLLLQMVGQCMRITLWQPTTLLLLATPVVFGAHAAVLRQYRPAGLRLPLLLSTVVLLTGFITGALLMITTIGGPQLLARAANVLLWWLFIGWCVACWAALPPSQRNVPATAATAPKWIVGALLFVMTAAPVIRAWQEFLVEAPSWARQCDARLPEYAAAASQHGLLIVKPIIGVTPRYVLVRGYDIQPNPRHPLSQSTAQYFRLDSVKTDGSLHPSF